ncbi:MAG: hypothetical protein ACI9Y1_002216 [Lentisphaeria bacterium]|jgi:hypothetical protein
MQPFDTPGGTRHRIVTATSKIIRTKNITTTVGPTSKLVVIIVGVEVEEKGDGFT